MKILASLRTTSIRGEVISVVRSDWSLILEWFLIRESHRRIEGISPMWSILGKDPSISFFLISSPEIPVVSSI